MRFLATFHEFTILSSAGCQHQILLLNEIMCCIKEAAGTADVTVSFKQFQEIPNLSVSDIIKALAVSFHMHKSPLRFSDECDSTGHYKVGIRQCMSQLWLNLFNEISLKQEIKEHPVVCYHSPFLRELTTFVCFKRPNILLHLHGTVVVFKAVLLWKEDTLTDNGKQPILQYILSRVVYPLGVY